MDQGKKRAAHNFTNFLCDLNFCLFHPLLIPGAFIAGYLETNEPSMIMRPIKFRVWHKPTLTMHHYLKAKFGPTYTNITLEGKFKDVDQITTLTVANNDLEVMQFTGLLDQNGKEIYEGDILAALESAESDAWHIEGHVYWRPELAGFILADKDGYTSASPDDFDAPVSWDKFIIIGNIYENPDLLYS
jgi:uncharacterized phage protein (TIGR01671 family)